MKKFGRRITSSLFFTILFSIAEIALIIWALYGLRELISSILTALAMEISDTAVYYTTRVFFSLVEVVFFLIVIDKKENPEYKIPWITLIFLNPYLAFVFYLFFANHGLRMREKIIIKETDKMLKKEYAVSTDEREQFKAEVPIRYRGIFKYLRHMTGMYGTTDNRVTYYKNGELFFPALLKRVPLLRLNVLNWEPLILLQNRMDQSLPISVLFQTDLLSLLLLTEALMPAVTESRCAQVISLRI